MERRLIKLSIANATGAKSTGVYRPLGAEASKLSVFQDELNRRTLAEQPKSIKLLPEAPKLTDVQRQMFADHSGKELYKKTESGKCESLVTFTYNSI